MFLVLQEMRTAAGKEWMVVAHGENGLKSIFPTLEKAETHAKSIAASRPSRVAVVEIEGWFEQDNPAPKVIFTRIN
ncbi:MAG: hypothetical protein V3S25_11100 [Nitrospirales bacterium]